MEHKELAQANGLYIVLTSVHGLIRAQNLELGRDADTGGQTKYVVELAKALSEHPDVAHVDLFTRQVIDSKIDSDYAEPVEAISPNANIVRLPFGPRRYLRKESLWPYLDSMADQALKYIRQVGRVPDIVHTHYADAGYVGVRLAGLLGIPLIHTGHSLGREKRRRLMDRGASPQKVEKQYNIHTRIEAEESAMDVASLVVASTQQEVEEQYSLYDNYHPKRMRVIPPGTDLSRFHPPRGILDNSNARSLVSRFLVNPKKPAILALSRADERKNIQTLVRAYGENEALQQEANLIIVAGNRDDIASMERGAKKVLTELLLLIDKYDLYGHVALPKHHSADDVPEFYRYAAKTHGVFVNPALTEPFGLTLIEAAASGLPIVATEDGGPTEIVRRCKNGILIDPLDAEKMAEVLLEAITNRSRWRQWSKDGKRGANKHYSWSSHANHYVKEVKRILGRNYRSRRIVNSRKSRLPTIDRLVVCDVDNTLLGDHASLRQLLDYIKQKGDRVGFGVASGRHLESTLVELKKWGVPDPDFLITSVGSEIHYGSQLTRDQGWHKHIDYRWEPEKIREAMESVPGVTLQKPENQREHKISYLVDTDNAPTIPKIVRFLRGLDLHVNAIFSLESNLDLLPIRASKGLALRYIGARWGIAPENILVAGDSGNDIEMLKGDVLGVVVGNYSAEVDVLKDEENIYFAKESYAAGILEGIKYYGILEDNFGKNNEPLEDVSNDQ